MDFVHPHPARIGFVHEQHKRPVRQEKQNSMNWFSFVTNFKVIDQFQCDRIGCTNHDFIDILDGKGTRSAIQFSRQYLFLHDKLRHSVHVREDS